VRTAALLAAGLLIAGCGTPRGGPPPDPGHSRVTIGSEEPVDGAQVADAQRILLARLDRAGVTGATVWTAGSSVVVDVPNASAEQVRILGGPGDLQVRPVPPGEAEPCTATGVTDPPREPSCGQVDAGGRVLGPAVLDGTAVGAVAGTDSRVVVTLTAAGARSWAAWTARHPGARVAVVVDGEVRDTPTVRPGSPVEFAAHSADEAAGLRTVLESEPYPASFRVVEVLSVA